MIIRIDHVGCAASDPAGAGALLAAMGLVRTDSGAAAAYGVHCDFWTAPGDPTGTAVEIVSPKRADSAVSDRLEAVGPGLYHVGFEVDDLETDVAALRQHGLYPIDREPCAGARPGMRVAFLYSGPAGLLIELVQYDLSGRAQHS